MIISSEASWFNWNAKLVAEVIAVIYKYENVDQAEALISEALEKLGVQDRHLCDFYCYLIDSNAKHQHKDRVFDSCKYLKQLLCRSSSVYVKKRAYGSMVCGLCDIGLPREAKNFMKEMRGLELKPSVFEFRSLVYAHGGGGWWVVVVVVLYILEKMCRSSVA